MKFLTKADHIFDRAIGVLALIAAFPIIFTMIVISYEVVTRYMLDRTSLWVTEFSTYSLLWLTFLGAAWLLRKEGHVRMELVLTKLNPRTQALMNVITSIVGILICLVLVRYGVQVAWESFQMGTYYPSLLRVPKWPNYSIIPLGSFLLSVQFLRRTLGYLAQWRELSKEEPIS